MIVIVLSVAVAVNRPPRVIVLARFVATVGRRVAQAGAVAEVGAVDRHLPDVARR